MDPHDLDRFVRAQDAGGAIDAAMAELREGRKASHWMWFVFPQVAGLGRSPTARRYGISGLDEARAYLAHPILGPRLVSCALLLTELATSDPVAIFGPLDAQKLRSSMTLFALADPSEEPFARVLGRFFAGEMDAATVERV